MRQENEHERKWIVLSIDPDIRRFPSVVIRQAYFDAPEGLRVRITATVNGPKCEITNKTGRGVSRVEKTEDVNHAAAEFLIESSPYRIEKRRYMRDGWEVDFFKDPLAGLVVAEFEMSSPTDEIELPPWIHSAVEVTDTVTNMHLARMSHDLSEASDNNPVRDRILTDRPRIVLTGGPCSGKSSAIEQLQADLSDILRCVPETATIIIDRVGAKPPPSDGYGMRRFQRTVHRVQCGFEEVSLMQALGESKIALLLDRGTMDGAAYLNGGVLEFEQVCLTQATAEHSRYTAIIILDVPPKNVYDAKKANNPARRETHEEATELGRRISQAWSGHPNVIHIGNFNSFNEKYAAIRSVVERVLK